ncbi:hypothetical protein, partial [Sinorhizobium fredii]
LTWPMYAHLPQPSVNFTVPLEPPAECRLAGTRGRDSASTGTRSDAFLVEIPARAGAHIAANLFGLCYWSPALSADAGRSNRRLLVKYDPRGNGPYLHRPSENFVEARLLI